MTRHYVAAHNKAGSQMFVQFNQLGLIASFVWTMDEATWFKSYEAASHCRDFVQDSTCKALEVVSRP